MEVVFLLHHLVWGQRLVAAKQVDDERFVCLGANACVRSSLLTVFCCEPCDGEF